MSRARGFGLIELLITMAIVAVLATIAVPSFAAMLERMRLTSSVNDYVAAIHGARSNAVREGRIVMVCPASDDGRCEDSAAAYGKGWLITDDPADAQSTERVWSTAKGIDVTANFPGSDPYIRFGADGVPRQKGGGFLAGSARFCAGDQGRKVVLSRTGRVRTESIGDC